MGVGWEGSREWGERGRRGCAALPPALGQILYLCEWGNEAGDADQAGVRKELGHLRNPADVLFAVSGRESQVLVEAMTDIVPIQGVTRDGVGDEVLFQSETDGCFPSARETCSEQATYT